MLVVPQPFPMPLLVSHQSFQGLRSGHFKPIDFILAKVAKDT